MSERYVDTIITYLSMRAPPQPVPAKPAGLRLALMKTEKVPLHYYRYLYGAVGVSWLWFERLSLDDAGLAATIYKAGVEVFVLYANGAPAGYYELDFTNRKQTSLVYFGLMPEWTGRKLGPWLLGTALEEAFSRGAEAAIVNTCTLDHPAALPLYQRLGFQPVAREKRRLAVPAHVDIPGHIAARPPP